MFILGVQLDLGLEIRNKIQFPSRSMVCTYLRDAIHDMCNYRNLESFKISTFNLVLEVPGGNTCWLRHVTMRERQVVEIDPNPKQL